MDPVTLTAISIGTTVAAGGVSAWGANESGKAAQRKAQYQAAVSDVNRQIAEQNADYALKVGETQAQQSGMEGRFKVGSTIARAGASGVDVNTGSKSRVIDSVQSIATHNQAVIRSDAAKRAYDHRVQAMEHSAQGTLYRAAGEDARREGTTKMFASLLGTASSVGSKWSDAQTRGVFS